MKESIDKAIATCDREPIHIPGSIQPHGAMLVVEKDSLRVLQASSNFATLCGRDAEENAPLDDAIGRCVRAAAGDPKRESPLLVQLPSGSFDLHVVDQAPLLLLEFTPASDEHPARHHRALQGILASLRGASTVDKFHETLARAVAGFTGFERVMVYRFDEDWHGEVIGEALLADVPTYLGHHFPASDIPAQARALYQRSWIRIIPDARYTPTPLVPAVNPLTSAPPDLSDCLLRSVSPVHLEYLKNMDVGASMSISLIVEGRLWGLVACHHRASLPLSQSHLAACEVLGQVASLEIEARQQAARLEEQMQATRIQTRFFDIISGEKNVVEALVKYTPDLLQFLGASGAAIHIRGRTTLAGTTPGTDQTARLIAWLNTQKVEPVFVTRSLSRQFPEAEAYTAQASGMIAIKLSRVESDYVLWFRPEVITTIKWAGDPDKQPKPGEMLHPRKSFATWEQKVTGQSLPWNEAEVAGARELLQATNALVLRRTETLLRTNVDLEKRNTDLNSFAYIASHDLREPLRGISNYCSFMREDHEADLSDEALRKLQTMSTLAVQCEELLEALNRYSRIGRIELDTRLVDIDTVLSEALNSIHSLIERENVEIRRPRPLPPHTCDPLLIREVFANLISNAVRYNDSGQKQVSLEWHEEEEGGATHTVFSVRDNGIGIPDKHQDAIFTIFRRLHPHDAFGGGTGAGLAIVRTIVEKHGGIIWVESKIGEGSTFHFTLG